MRAATDLRNWLAFLTLRNDKNAQWEIRQFAIHVEEELAQHFPRTLQFFRQDRSRWAEFNAWRAMQTQVSG
jgi:thymidylate synthase ThyX